MTSRSSAQSAEGAPRPLLPLLKLAFLLAELESAVKGGENRVLGKRFSAKSTAPVLIARTANSTSPYPVMAMTGNATPVARRWSWASEETANNLVPIRDDFGRRASRLLIPSPLESKSEASFASIPLGHDAHPTSQLGVIRANVRRHPLHPAPPAGARSGPRHPGPNELQASNAHGECLRHKNGYLHRA